MKLIYKLNSSYPSTMHLFILYGLRRIEGYKAKDAGFIQDSIRRAWITYNYHVAKKFIEFADEKARDKINELEAKDQKDMESSYSVQSDFYPKIKSPFQYYDYQRAGVKHLLSPGNKLLGDDMGLGKTLQVIGYCNEVSPNKVLIVCLASIKYNWRNEFLRFSTVDYLYQIVDSKTESLEPGVNIYIINYDILDRYIKDLHRIKFDLVVGDEIHYVKNPRAKRSKAFYTLKAGKKIGITGTPMPNRPVELFHIMKWLEPKVFPRYSHYCIRYCASEGSSDTKGASNLEELNYKLRTSGVMIRRLKKDALKQLPEKVRQIVLLEGMDQELIEKHQQIIQKVKKVGFDQVFNIEGSEGGYLFEEIASIRKQTAMMKIPLVKDFISNILNDKEKITIFGHHTSVLESVRDSFSSFNPLLITGSTHPKQRQGIVETFQESNGNRIFIGSMSACGTGITLTAADTMIFIEQDFVPGTMAQVEDRIHRIGQKNTCFIYHLIMRHSIDAWLASMVQEKKINIELALN